MAQRYPEKVRQEIHSLDGDGYGPTEIRDILAGAEGGLDDPWIIPIASIKGIRSAMRKQLGNPRQIIKPGKQQEAASASQRRYQAALQKQGDYLLGQIETNGYLTPKEQGQLERCELIMARIERRDREPAKPQTTGRKRGQNAAASRADDGPQSLADMARRIATRDAAAEDVEPAPSTDQPASPDTE